jgi:hypothetical protein
MDKQPSVFYRYRTFSVMTLASLCRDTLYFAHPGTFNDPLDCKPTIECDSNIEELRNLLTFLIQQRVSTEVHRTLKKVGIRDERATAHANKSAQFKASDELASIAYHATNPDHGIEVNAAEIWLIGQAIERELKKHYERGVCCFSTTYSNPLLWSHYGDQHKGICIGYSLERTPRPQPQKIVYGGSRFIKTSTLIQAFLDKDQKAMDDLDRDILLRKANGWKYEREWRLVGKQGMQDSPLLLKEITFGLRCTTPVIHSIVQALSGREKAIDFYEMHEVRGKYCLRRRRVDLDELAAFLPKTAVSGEEMFGDLIEEP